MSERPSLEKLYLSHKDRIKAANDVGKILKRQVEQVKRVVLFGSVARNTDGPDSDVDMLVTYWGVPSPENDNFFHGQVIDTLKTAGISLGNPKAKKESANKGKVTLQTISEVALTHPNLYLPPFEFTLIGFLEKVSQDGKVLFLRSLKGRDLLVEMTIEATIDKIQSGLDRK
ncbi:MAG: hypothetical protein UX85_C0002G0085 [Candidatus Beckwithbacteria bacterium GW2011_GWB1_47_15]|uniref:Polymerase nucleotidyl transferase domain-containing protein n=1 Tax=Candidatus Beckwithbacteria bacterium GW2011_GWB1_47_15 TaxID=1618371 RepID=A0A0G1UVH7_9BACT|nr:MAG: hypothetical protein UY43_C0001G0673 [Candidatus Beckwithbacteria bacterium GW2011_GWC1_49_16]KKU35651.1 MAG: hypothetical protein UX50_C0002G0078 [Candidatus Beckwithbacteria bacterium GW2011_GWA1_46_30]KKU61705.1 MAG: hypothetical protein UX85_C0002G0085 [Candidatus Beckwithbacteria bacterium GW2011_GWB1_47_15]KKU72208.1 MAG: hypothetical protein UX97_C0001G0078 [Candidatus Beckwithbacteria bacterium GW2011_GWA2_47_25]KKW05030.1 MAG: hypothetical protein UY37_C0001G0134 [Candidatus Be